MDIFKCEGKRLKKKRPFFYKIVELALEAYLLWMAIAARGYPVVKRNVLLAFKCVDGSDFSILPSFAKGIVVTVIQRSRRRHWKLH